METKSKLMLLMEWIDALPNWVPVVGVVIGLLALYFIAKIFFGITSLGQAADDIHSAWKRDREEQMRYQQQWDYMHGLEAKN